MYRGLTKEDVDSDDENDEMKLNELEIGLREMDPSIYYYYIYIFIYNTIRSFFDYLL
jgi:hypothetical protein